MSCEHVHPIYTATSVTSKRKSFRAFAYAALLVAATGCSGINASKSISPLDFILPGLLKAEPASEPVDVTIPEMTTAQQVALAQ
ncbi:MAG: hypothetical protein EXS35_17810 [Pedosphaera sp.]|nr:hypothetical protein [Pedosphaera sp.]